jgi:SOS-response transcriptional repressor LexA
MSGRKPHGYIYHDLLAFIIRYKQTHDGNSPTCREMSDGLGGISLQTVYVYLRQLQSDGAITITPGQRRNIQVFGGKWSMGA